MNDGFQPMPRERSDAKTLVIVTWSLLLAGLVTFHLAAVAAVIIAYIQRDEARGTLWEEHYRAIIATFWVGLAGMIVGGILLIVLIGFVVWLAVAVWFLYRGLRGLLHAIDERPY